MNNDNYLNFFLERGLSYLQKNFDANLVTQTNHRDSRSGSGISPSVCCWVWTQIHEGDSNLLPENLLWALLFLKVYKTETIHASIVETDAKNFREKVFKVIELISSLSEDIVSKLSFYYYH